MDLISRQAAIDAINHICPVDTEYDCTLLDRVDVRCVLSDLPSVHPKLPENWWKTDHGYMWLCPHCGLPVHSDFEECLRCGIKRQSAQPEFARDINVPSTETAERTAKTSQNVPNEDLISRKTAIAYAISGRTREFDGDKWIRVSEVRESLKTMPSAQPERNTCCYWDNESGYCALSRPSAQPERKKGKWKRTYLDHEAMGERPSIFYCSVCNQCIVYPVNYCPNCGAKMEVEHD